MSGDIDMPRMGYRCEILMVDDRQLVQCTNITPRSVLHPTRGSDVYVCSDHWNNRPDKG